MVENVKLTYERIGNELKEAGYKLTPQREATVETLIANKSKLLTAEEIFMSVVKQNPAIGLATVYRTLDILDELNLVKKIQFLDGLTRYDLLLSDDQGQPFYLVCSNCKSITEVREDLLPEIPIRIEEVFQFEIHAREVTYHGICQNCQVKERV